MSSWVKRERSLADEIPSPGKRPRVNYSLVRSSLHPIINHRVALNPADCDLDFNIDGNGLKGSALYDHGFAYCWSGARANTSITAGKYCFSCKILSTQPVEIDETTPDQNHLCRIGISTGEDKVGNLGETEQSFGFSNFGKFSNFGNFSTYGERFDIGDTILCAVDMESKPMCSIGFAKNGKWLGIARYFNQSLYFPHVLLKNVVVEMQFGYEDGLVPLNGYRPWGCAFGDGNGLVGPAFNDDVGNRELIMMVGLPGTGKTTWAENWANHHPEKRYIVLGINLALDKMKVSGLLWKQDYGERLMERASEIFNILLIRASKTPRNFIIDHTNVYKSARNSKLKPFVNYQKIAVVVFPRPEEYKARSEKRFREMGKEVPVNEMIANFVLPKSKDMPGTDEYFDQVIYVELNMMESERCLDEMKAKLSYGFQFLGQRFHGCYQSQTTLPKKDGFLLRDDFNHRRSYSGYEHRACAPMGIYVNYQKSSSYHTPTHETMDLSPRYTTTYGGSGPRLI
ncbi:hypothetical protein LXL04_034619 [Taraxacum kok-saghyz]